MTACRNCGKKLTGDEIALHKRMIGRGENTFMCLPCLAEFFGCTEELLYKKIEHFKKSGCLLFCDAEK
ncbi:MAG: hypothetical protein J6Q74_00910 [Clostridia bacterium]|nr:hypothetical protein [Clostridia bacterium]